ncbi:hypothetical protein BDZ91DRAFT_759411 [Kalaharituber pfeilii]|nr:hypothetical protein BDZ91DRAFT_759411 [Kalaharituber pfeilii]
MPAWSPSQILSALIFTAKAFLGRSNPSAHYWLPSLCSVITGRGSRIPSPATCPAATELLHRSWCNATGLGGRVMNCLHDSVLSKKHQWGVEPPASFPGGKYFWCVRAIVCEIETGAI